MTKPRLAAADLQAFAAASRAISPISDVALVAAERALTVTLLPRGGAFLRAGEHASLIGTVVSGFLRELYVLANGTERTKAFVFEGNATGSLADLLSSEPSRADIVAEEATRLVCLPYAVYRDLRQNHVDWARCHLAVVEALFIHKARREHELLGLDALGRYQALLHRLPTIEQRVSAKHLASYLGITPVHLSRLRRLRTASRRGAEAPR